MHFMVAINCIYWRLTSFSSQWRLRLEILPSQHIFFSVHPFRLNYLRLISSHASRHIGQQHDAREDDPSQCVQPLLVWRWFTMKRRYIKCTPLPLPVWHEDINVCSLQLTGACQLSTVHINLKLKINDSLSFCFNGDTSRWTWVSRCLLKLRMMEVVVTNGAI